MKTFRILLVDDNPLFLDITQEFLRSQAEILVVGTACSSKEAVARASELKPDFILLDLNMPGKSGLAAIPELKRVHPQGRIVVLTMMNEDIYRQAALSAGANGFVSKGEMGSEIIPLILHMAAVEN